MYTCDLIVLHTRYGRGGLSHCQCECMFICLLLTSSHLLTSLIRTFLVIFLLSLSLFLTKFLFPFHSYTVYLIRLSARFVRLFVRSYTISPASHFFGVPFSKFLSLLLLFICKNRLGSVGCLFVFVSSRSYM